MNEDAWLAEINGFGKALASYLDSQNVPADVAIYTLAEMAGVGIAAFDNEDRAILLEDAIKLLRWAAKGY